MKLLLTILTSPLRLAIGLLIWAVYAISSTIVAIVNIVIGNWAFVEEMGYSDLFTHCLPRVFIWTAGNGPLFE